MFKYVVIFIIVLIGCSHDNKNINEVEQNNIMKYFNTNVYGKRMNIDGIDCIIVLIPGGYTISTSCNWK